MSKKNKRTRIPNQFNHNYKKSTKGLADNINNDCMEHCEYFNKNKIILSFINDDPNAHPLHKCNEIELKSLLETFKLLEQLTWIEALQHKGLRIKALDNRNIKTKIPDYFSKDLQLYEIRVNKKMRIHGFINKNKFSIIWYDRNHEVCPKN